MSCPSPACVLASLVLALALGAAPAVAGALAPPVAEAPAPPECSVAEVPGLATQYARAVRESRADLDPRRSPAGDDADVLAAGPAADFWRVTAAILGPAGAALVAAGDVTPFQPVGGTSRLALPCDRGVRARDQIAWSMGLGGYSAQEIADVLAGHLTLADLDGARAALMAGQPRPSVAAFLEARWREPQTAVTARAAPAPGPWQTLAHLEADLLALSARHGVAPELVRAVIAAESAGNPRAVSSAGAIGLMQLMPATAASLGVDPWQPTENLAGGIAYLSSLLRAYGGNARLALIAYNAGPQHANRVRDGSAVAYRETRRYLEAIDARYPLP